MNLPSLDTAFAGTIPQLYEQCLVPLILAPDAGDIASRVAHSQPSPVLEIAAGTSVVTRQLAQRPPSDVSIVAMDLNPSMLGQAAAVGTSRPVQ